MVVWTDSCQRSRTQATINRAYWTASFNTGWSATGGRNNGPKNVGNFSGYPRSPVPSGDTFIAFVRHVRGGFGDGAPFLSCRLVQAEHIALRHSGSGALYVTRNGTTIATTGGGLIDDGITLHGFAMKVKLSATVGTVEVWLNGVIVPALTFSGNTLGQATPTWDSFQVGNSGGGGNTSWCDLLIADGTNPTGNDIHDLVPDACVDYVFPTGTGYSSQFVGSDADSVNNYLLVDENSSNDDTDYVVSTNPAIDGYVLGDHPTPGGVILSRSAIAVARKTTTAVATLRVGTRTGGVNTMGASVGLLQTYTEVRANLAGMTEANFNASEMVVELL